MNSSKKKSKEKFAKLERFIRALASGTEPEVKGIPSLRKWWRRLGNSKDGISGVNAMALEEILDDFCPNYISKNGNSRAVVDEWIEVCVLEVLEKKPEMDLEKQIAHSIKTLKEKLKAPAVNYAKKNLYDVRSVLVHTGQAQIPDSDLYTLRRMTFESIFKLMRDEKFQDINTDNALENWFENSCLNGFETQRQT